MSKAVTLPKRSINPLLFLLSLLVLVWVIYQDNTGKLPSTGDREVLPPEARTAQGGYRSFHFWHSGYSGGK
jgi:hypothetical protein